MVAASFVLFGPGEDNILWAFQIGFAGALVLGLTQLMLADHDGPIDRRDWLGLLAGLAGQAAAAGGAARSTEPSSSDSTSPASVMASSVSK